MSNASANEFILNVEGMSCSHCVNRVQKALADTPGVLEASVDLEKGTAEIRTAGNVEAAQLVSAVEKAGYAAQAV